MFFFPSFVELTLAQVGNARMAWKRVPSEHKNGSVLKAVHAVLCGLWSGDWEAVNRAVGTAQVKNELWGALGSQVRRAELALLARSHSVISGVSAAAVLGVAAGEAGPLLLQSGWTATEGTEFYSAPPAARAGAAQTTDAAQLTQLTNYIVFLERRA